MSHLTVGAGLALSLRKRAISQLRWATLFSCYTEKQLYTDPSNTILKWQVWHSTSTWRCNNSGMKPGNATWQNSLHPSQHFFLTVCTKMKNQQTELTPADASSWKIYKYIRCLILFSFSKIWKFFCVCREKKNFNWERARFLNSKMSKVDLYALFLWLNDWCGFFFFFFGLVFFKRSHVGMKQTRLMFISLILRDQTYWFNIMLRKSVPGLDPAETQ